MDTGKMVSKTSRIELGAALPEVFALFGPVKEQAWAEGWHPHILWPESGEVQEHMVFQAASHDGEHPSVSIWIVSQFDLGQACIEYTVFTDDRIWWINVQCHPEKDGAATSAEVTYTYMGLTEEAHQLNQAALDKMFRHELKDWETAINHYLMTGTQLKHSHS